MCISFPTAELHYVKLVYALISFRDHIICRQLCVPVTFDAKMQSFNVYCGGLQFLRSAAMVQTDQWPIVHKAVTQRNSLLINKSTVYQYHYTKRTVQQYRYTKRAFQVYSLVLYKQDFSNQQSTNIILKEGIFSQLSTVINRGHFKPTIYCFTKTFKTNSLSLLSLCKEDILRQQSITHFKPIVYRSKQVYKVFYNIDFLISKIDFQQC